jgi:hypothetical protein
MRNLLFLILVGLVVYTIIDVIKSDRDERSGVPAPLWILLILALPVVGSIGWLVASRSARARRPDGGSSGGGGGTRPTPPSRGPRRPSGPVAPDDDPEFLWRLAQQQRRARGEASSGGTDGAPHRDPADGDSPGHDGHDTSGPRATP